MTSLPHHPSHRPIIGVTADVEVERARLRLTRPYVDAIARAGGLPVILSDDLTLLDDYLAMCQGFILSGGDDPRMEPFGELTHPKATPIDDRRQAFETALLERVHDRPTLGICLGFQMMALVNDGAMNQHLPDNFQSHDQHWGHRQHEVHGALGHGRILSHHRQGITDAGRLEVIAEAPDGLIEAVRDPDRPFYVGVQWHPERTGTGDLGDGLFVQLMRACSSTNPH